MDGKLEDIFTIWSFEGDFIHHSALNVAVGLGELMKGRDGAQCSFCGMVGDDEFGAFLRRRLASAGVRDRTQTSATSTGSCIILSGSHDRGFVTCVGATGLLSTAHLAHMEESASEGLAKRLHVHISGYFSCHALQAGLAGHLRSLRAIAAGRGQHITISFDTNCDATGKWGSGVLDVLAEVDIFLPNELEAQAIADTMPAVSESAADSRANRAAAVMQETNANVSSANGELMEAADGLASKRDGPASKRDGPAAPASQPPHRLASAANRLACVVREAVVVTCGKEGCIVQTRDAVIRGEAPRRFGAPSDIVAVDATGAGDAFDAAFIFRWAVCGGSLEDGVRAGSCCGALCTETIGANANLPSATTLAQREQLYQHDTSQIA
jgi:sugar/nucleoside kinase (ribokinase family)